MLSLQAGYIERSVLIVCNITLNTAIGPDLSILNYTWYHNNIDVTTNKRLILPLNNNGKAFTSTLQITSAQSSNAGVYQCSADIVGSNTITSNSTLLCLKGIIIICNQLHLYLIIFIISC